AVGIDEFPGVAFVVLDGQPIRKAPRCIKEDTLEKAVGMYPLHRHTNARLAPRQVDHPGLARLGQQRADHPGPRFLRDDLMLAHDAEWVPVIGVEQLVDVVLARVEHTRRRHGHGRKLADDGTWFRDDGTWYRSGDFKLTMSERVCNRAISPQGLFIAPV